MRTPEEKMAARYGKIRRMNRVYKFTPELKYQSSFVGFDAYDHSRDALLSRIYDWCCLTYTLQGIN